MNGVLATFDSVHELERVARALHARGVTRMEAFTPFAWEPLDELFPKERKQNWLSFLFSETNLPGAVTLITAGAACPSVFLTLTLAETWSNPFDAGGRPLFSWPVYVPITFVLTVLSAAAALFVAYFWAMRLPEPYHPLFDVAEFRMDQERFHLFLASDEPLFTAARPLLGSARLTEVRA